MSRVFPILLQKWFGDMGFNMDTTGIILEHNGEKYHFGAKFGCVVPDEKGMKEIASLKGASGRKPCPYCWNVVGRCKPSDVASDDCLVHFHCADKSKFKLHDANSYIYMLDLLATSKHTLGNGDFKQLEIDCGMKYDEKAWPFVKAALATAPLPDSLFTDWMHNILASGSVGSFEVNHFVLHSLRATPFTLQTLDAFAAQVVAPQHYTKLAKTFFQDRIVKP